MSNLTYCLAGREYGCFVQRKIEKVLEKKVAVNSTLELSYQVPLTARSTFCIGFSPDRRTIATSHGDHSVRISDCIKMKTEHVLKGHSRTPWCVEFHPKINSLLASGCLSGQVFIWNLDNKDQIGTLIFQSQRAISSIAFHPIDSILVITSGNVLVFYDWNQFKVIKKLVTKTEVENIRYVKFLPLGDKLLTGIRNHPSQTNFSTSTEDNITPVVSVSSPVNSKLVSSPVNSKFSTKYFNDTNCDCSKYVKCDKKHCKIDTHKRKKQLNLSKMDTSLINDSNEASCSSNVVEEVGCSVDKLSSPCYNASVSKENSINERLELQNCIKCRENSINQSSSSLRSVNGNSGDTRNSTPNTQVTQTETLADNVMHQIMETQLYNPAVRLLIARTFAAHGSIAVASNIAETTNRIQLWNSSNESEPDVKNTTANVIIPRCKIHNDNSIDISSDGSLLAAFLPIKYNSPMDIELQVISLKPENYLNCIYSKKFGPNAVSVSFSPLYNYIVVGLASRKFERCLSVPKKQVIGQILELQIDSEKQSPDSKDIFNIVHENSYTNEYHFSVNTVRFHPMPGMGIVYGSNRGHVQHFQIGPDLNLMK
ncbi:activating molecule in BECN1-regulated autophagy protein 1B isoform X1 [Hydra vulgaris]|uniref:activating molecule in BECN1-regulated autophagy protein 1B isoform X1 n=1 Tax=Hydra vulgaris TaxID=6087 RepID=UPI001F5EF3D3|nr:activating molecule in BECN1-regulated autophagy protein 1B [Hydra vulgaris]